MTVRVAIVGATGIAGQQFLGALPEHPYIEVTQLAASPRSAGKKYIDAIRAPSGQIGWYADQPLDERYAQMTVVTGEALDLDQVDLVFSAVESDAARPLEALFAEKKPVVSTASAYRYEDDVPIIIPAVNGDHAALIERQKARGWAGFVVPIPNCTTTGLAISLAPLHRAFGVERVVMTSMQAISGAGRSPGVIGLDIIDNIVPYIPKEEEKVERETNKLLGHLTEAGVDNAALVVSSHCNRVPVLEGHFETVSVALKKPATTDDVKAAMRGFGADINPDTHPSAPAHWITVSEDPFRPQPRLDRLADRGMCTSVGRLREERALGGASAFKYCLVSHNTRMGAALGAVLVAEDLKNRGLLPL